MRKTCISEAEMADEGTSLAKSGKRQPRERGGCEIAWRGNGFGNVTIGPDDSGESSSQK
jgi:hypothetical protein